MLAWGDREAHRRSLYNGTASPSLCRRLHRLAALISVMAGLANSGCTYRLASLSSKDGTDPQSTGSIVQPADHVIPIAEFSAPAALDLAYARAAASNVLARGGKDSSVPWQNPQTGAGGNITPLASSYTDGGVPCRDFLASYVHGGSQDWLSGSACRTSDGSWEVKRLKPLKPN